MADRKKSMKVPWRGFRQRCQTSLTLNATMDWTQWNKEFQWQNWIFLNNEQTTTHTHKEKTQQLPNAMEDNTLSHTILSFQNMGTKSRW